MPNSTTVATNTQVGLGEPGRGCPSTVRGESGLAPRSGPSCVLANHSAPTSNANAQTTTAANAHHVDAPTTCARQSTLSRLAAIPQAVPVPVPNNAGHAEASTVTASPAARCSRVRPRTIASPCHNPGLASILALDTSRLVRSTASYRTRERSARNQSTSSTSTGTTDAHPNRVDTPVFSSGSHFGLVKQANSPSG